MASDTIESPEAFARRLQLHGVGDMVTELRDHDRAIRAEARREALGETEVGLRAMMFAEPDAGVRAGLATAIGRLAATRALATKEPDDG